MASSLIPVLCQLCEADIKLTWKCEDCDLLMCDRCRQKVHPKFKHSKEHTIINIDGMMGARSCTEDFKNGPELRDVKCKHHIEQNYCLFCQTCEQLICASCVTKIHKAHDYVEIREAYNKLTTRLAEETEKMKMGLLELDEIEIRAEQVKNVENTKYEETKQEIFDHQKALGNEVDRYASKFKEELDDSLQRVNKSMETQHRRVQNNREAMQQRLTLAYDALKERDAIGALKEGAKILKLLDQTEEQPFYFETISVPKFVPSNYEMVEKHFGFLQNTLTRHIKTDFKIQRKLTTSNKMINVHWVVTSTNGLWIGHNTGYNPLVQRVIPKWNGLTVAWSFDIKVYGMALTSEDNLLLCVNASRLKLVNGKTGKISDSTYDISPFVTRAIHVTKNNQIIVAAKDKGATFPVSGRRVVIAMNENGKQTAIYEYDRNSKPLFTFPSNITSNSKGNTFVIDMISNKRHTRIVVLQPGRVDPLNVYSGCPEINSQQLPFKAVRLVNTPSDNVIITDRDTRTLHILNSEGYLISLCNLRNIGVVEEPYSLAINPSGLLYVGCLRADQESNVTKLYEMKYSGC